MEKKYSTEDKDIHMEDADKLSTCHDQSEAEGDDCHAGMSNVWDVRGCEAYDLLVQLDQTSLVWWTGAGRATT